MFGLFTPKSMEKELAQWNGGDGIDMGGWLNCSGNFSLATGYAMLFNPQFTEYKGYIALADDYKTEKDFSLPIYEFKHQDKDSIWAGKWVINQIFLDSIQHYDCDDKSEDKFMIIGNSLKEIYEAKLHLLYPQIPVKVEFNPPSDRQDIYNYEFIAWQDFR